MRKIKVSVLALALVLGVSTTAATAAFAHGWEGQGAAQGYRQGMMQPGCGGPQQGGFGMGGQGKMGPGMGRGQQIVASKDLSTDDVRHFLEHRLALQGNKRLQIGKIEEQDKDTIMAEIQTVDGSLVQCLKVDRHSGAVEQTE